MANTISPNMNLVVPSVGSENGPTYAFDVNTSLTLIDQHDHSPGKGVQITPAGMNINVALNFNNNLATNLKAIQLDNQSGPNTTPGTISVAPNGGTGVGDLYYTDYSGATFPLTQNGAVVAIATIEGITWASGTFSFTDAQGGANTTPASLDAGSVTVRPTIANAQSLNYGITIGPPSGITSAYNFTLPANTATNSFLTFQSGVVSATIPVANGITAGNIANNTITSAQIANNTITATQIASGTITSTQISGSAGIAGSQLSSTAGITPGQLANSSTTEIIGTFYSNATATFTTVVGGTVALSAPVNNRPIMISFSGNPLICSGGFNRLYRIIISNGSSTIVASNYIVASPGGDGNITNDPGIFNWSGTIPGATAGYNQVALQFAFSSGGGSISITTSGVNMYVTQV